MEMLKTISVWGIVWLFAMVTLYIAARLVCSAVERSKTEWAGKLERTEEKHGTKR